MSAALPWVSEIYYTIYSSNTLHILAIKASDMKAQKNVMEISPTYPHPRFGGKNRQMGNVEKH